MSLPQGMRWGDDSSSSEDERPYIRSRPTSSSGFSDEEGVVIKPHRPPQDSKRAQKSNSSKTHSIKLHNKKPKKVFHNQSKPKNLTSLGSRLEKKANGKNTTSNERVKLKLKPRSVKPLDDSTPTPEEKKNNDGHMNKTSNRRPAKKITIKKDRSDERHNDRPNEAYNKNNKKDKPIQKNYDKTKEESRDAPNRNDKKIKSNDRSSSRDRSNIKTNGDKKNGLTIPNEKRTGINSRERPEPNNNKDERSESSTNRPKSGRGGGKGRGGGRGRGRGGSRKSSPPRGGGRGGRGGRGGGGNNKKSTIDNKERSGYHLVTKIEIGRKNGNA